MRMLLPFLVLLILVSLILRLPLTGPVEAAGVDRQRPALLDCTTKDGVSVRQMHQAQQAWARYLHCKVEETVEIGKGVKMVFVLVPPGKFKMGSPKAEQDYVTRTFFRDERPKWFDEETLHEVSLSEDMSK
jgi:formylglycine-generating enzyme required for sulfatase activity